jgi:DNA-binding PadR family transcriptional regulator
MKLDIFCLGILLERNYSGYEIHKVINTALAHLRQASFGALYPALNRLQAKEFISSEAVSTDLLNNGLGKRIFSITDKGRAHFKVEIKKITAAEVVNSDFLSALHFSNSLTPNEVSTLVDERLADLQIEQRRLLKLPNSDITEGQRFAIRYTLSQISAAIAFLKGEGKAIQTLMAKRP